MNSYTFFNRLFCTVLGLASLLSHAVPLYNSTKQTLVLTAIGKDEQPFSVEVPAGSSLNIPELGSDMVTYKTKDSLVQEFVFNPVSSLLTFFGVGKPESWINAPKSISLQVVPYEPNKNIYTIVYSEDNGFIVGGEHDTKAAVVKRLMDRKKAAALLI